MSDERISKESAEAIVTFLKSNVPKSDIPDVENALKQDFVLGKKKGKKKKRKGIKKKTRSLSRKEKKALGFYDIPRNSVKYVDMLPINEVWTEYITQLLELDKPVPNCTSKNWEIFTQTFYRADFHGCVLKVIRSKCPSYIDMIGICIMDTRNTFKIVSKDNVVTTIPKRECVFQIFLNNLRITLFGKMLCVRPAERSTKKIRAHLHPDL